MVARCRHPPSQRSLQLLLASIVGLLALATAAAAQEVATILHRAEWYVAGVCIGPHQCGFCSASNSLHRAARLRIAPPEDVSVQFSGKPAAHSVILEIGSRTFTLDRQEDDSFAASKPDAGTIINAMRHARQLTLRVGDGTAPARYRYSLADYPKVHAALLRACPSALQ